MKKIRDLAMVSVLTTALLCQPLSVSMIKPMENFGPAQVQASEVKVDENTPQKVNVPLMRTGLVLLNGAGWNSSHGTFNSASDSFLFYGSPLVPYGWVHEWKVAENEVWYTKGNVTMIFGIGLDRIVVKEKGKADRFGEYRGLVACNIAGIPYISTRAVAPELGLKIVDGNGLSSRNGLAIKLNLEGSDPRWSPEGRPTAWPKVGDLVYGPANFPRALIPTGHPSGTNVRVDQVGKIDPATGNLVITSFDEMFPEETKKVEAGTKEYARTADVVTTKDGRTFTEAQVGQAINKLRTKYPHGSKWDGKTQASGIPFYSINDYYRLYGGQAHMFGTTARSGGCAGFVAQIWLDVFGEKQIEIRQHQDFSAVKIGDCVGSEGHVWIVTGKNADGSLIAANGNSGREVRWDVRPYGSDWVYSPYVK